MRNLRVICGAGTLWAWVGLAACSSSSNPAAQLPSHGAAAADVQNLLPGAGTAPKVLSRPCRWLGVGDATLVAYAPSGKLLGVASGGSVKLFDATSGTPLVETDPAHAGKVSSFDFARRADTMAVVVRDYLGSSEERVDVWRVPSLDHLARIAASGPTAVALSPDGALVAVSATGASASQIDVTRVADQTNLAHLPGDLVKAIAFSEDGKLLVTAADSGWTTYDTKTWQRITSGNQSDRNLNSGNPTTSGDTRLHLSDDARGLAFVDASGASVADATAPPGTFHGTLLDATGAISAVDISNDGKLLAAGTVTGDVYLWANDDTTTMNAGLPQKMLKGDGARLRSIAFDPTANELAGVSELGTLRVWQLSSGQERWSVMGPHGAARLLAVTPEGKLALAMPFDDYYGRVAFGFDPRTGANSTRLELGTDRLLHDFLGRWALCAARWDASAVACSTEAGVVEFTPAASPTKVASAASNATDIADLVYSPDGRELAVADTAVGVTLYHPGSGGSEALYRASPAGVGGSRVAALAYASNATRLAGGEFGTNSQIYVWDPSGGATTAKFPLPVRLGAVGVALSPDGGSVASVDGWTRDVVVHRVSDGKRTDYVATAEPVLPAGPNDNHFDAVTFSPSGARLAAIAFFNESTVIFRVSDGTPEFLLPGGSAGVSFLDETTLLRGELDGTVGVWCLK